VVATLGGALALIGFARARRPTPPSTAASGDRSAIDDALRAGVTRCGSRHGCWPVSHQYLRIEEALHTGNRANLLDQADEFRRQEMRLGR
jgi:hypothetical protein